MPVHLPGKEQVFIDVPSDNITLSAATSSDQSKSKNGEKSGNNSTLKKKSGNNSKLKKKSGNNSKLKKKSRNARAKKRSENTHAHPVSDSTDTGYILFCFNFCL